MNMYHEIERKFLVNKMPSLYGVKKVEQERYFIQRGVLFEEGIKRKGELYQYESKFTLSKKERTRENVWITKEEFEKLKEKGTQILERDSYIISKKKPIISIKKYKGVYRGLVLAEVEFDSVGEMEEFIPFPWMGIEVTDTPFGRDATLIDLDRKEFLKILKDVEEKARASWGNEGFL